MQHRQNNQLRYKVDQLRKKVEDKYIISNWVEYVKWYEDHPDEIPNMTLRFRKWLEGK